MGKKGEKEVDGAGGAAGAASDLGPGSGTLSSCPLTAHEYQQFWNAMSSGAERMPQQVSRLHTTMDGLLSHKSSVKAFQSWLETQGPSPPRLLQFLIAADRLMFGRKPVENIGDVVQGIFDKFVAPRSSHNIGLDAEMQKAISAAIAKDAAIAKATGEAQNKPQCFRGARKHVYTVLQSTHLGTYQKSQDFFKYCVASLTPSSSATLEDILCNDNAMLRLQDFMASEGAESLVQFWLISQNFKDQLRQVGSDGKPVLSDEQASQDAQALFGRYFPAESPESLGVDNSTRAETHANCFKHPGRPPVHCFMRSQHLIYTALRKYFFPEFLKSEFYNQFLQRLMAFADSAVGSNSSAPLGAAAGGAGGTGGDGGDGGDGGEDGAAQTPRKSMRRATSLGTVDKWGVLHKDMDLSNPLFAEEDPKGLGTRVKSGMAAGMKAAVGIKRKDKTAEEEAALQETRKIINDVYREMRQKQTMDAPLRTPKGSAQRRSVILSGLFTADGDGEAAPAAPAE
eukprot:gene7703-13612_t